MTTRTPTALRRNRAALRWLRAAAFAVVTYLGAAAFGFYPAAVPPALALVVGVLGLLAPGMAVLAFLIGVGIPMLAGDFVAGAVFLVLGVGTIQYLSDAHGRAFLVIALAFVATLVKAEWAVVALAGFLLGASDGAVAALIACLVIECAGLMFGVRSLGTVATGGSTPLVDLQAISSIETPLSFGWVGPALARIAPTAFLDTVAGARDAALLAVQPLLWAGAAALAGSARRPAGDPRRRALALAGVAGAVVALAAFSAGVSLAFGGPLRPASAAVAGAVALLVGLVGAAVSEWVFTPELVRTRNQGTSAEDADVDELLRMISTAEEELASKHTAHRTVLITDMKSFSRLTQELGSTETAKLVQRHRDLLLPIIERAGGRGKSTGGDGLLAAFPTPSAAIGAAVGMQQALEAYNASRPGEEAVLIRAGIASGEVVLDKGGKPFLGDALNLAARVMSLADGGQVFTTGSDAQTADALPFGSVTHGSFHLKNIAHPVPITEVLWRADQPARPPHAAADET